MSACAGLQFRSARKATSTTPASIDPSGRTVYGQNLPKLLDKVDSLAQSLNVTPPSRFVYEDPEELQQFAEEMQEDAPEIAEQYRQRLANQLQWHSIADAVRTFTALLTALDRPPAPSAQLSTWQAAAAWDVNAMLTALREAQADGEQEFRVSIV
jgi:hypothetical protein